MPLDKARWIEDVLRRSLVLETYMASREQDDTSGLCELTDALVFAEGPVSGSGLLLAGPVGSGRHTAAAHVVARLAQMGYSSVFLDGKEDCGPSRELLSTLTDRFYDEKKPLCLIVDEPGGDQELLCALGELLCEYFLSPEYPALFAVLVSEDIKLPSLLRGRIQVIRTGLPDRQLRRAFLDKKAAGIKNYVSLDDLADETHGLSYADILDVAARLQAEIDITDSAISKEALAEVTALSRPPEQTREPLLYVAEKIEALARAMETAALTPVMSAAPAAAPKPQTVEDTGPELEKIEEMSVHDLAAELFGEEWLRSVT